MLTPEESIEIQNAIGADIMMQLDDVVDVKETDYERFKTATYRQVLHLGSWMLLIHSWIVKFYLYGLLTLSSDGVWRLIFKHMIKKQHKNNKVEMKKVVVNEF